MATLTPRTRTGSLTTTSHLSPVVPRAVAHQLGNQGNDLQKRRRRVVMVALRPGWWQPLRGRCAKRMRKMGTKQRMGRLGQAGNEGHFQPASVTSPQWGTEASPWG